MTAADRAAAVIRGETRAQDFLRTLRCVLGDGDELLRLLQPITDRDELAGVCRVLQKTIERAARG